MAYLVSRPAGGGVFRINLPVEGEIIIGRSPERATVVVGAGSVSSRHCSIQRGADAFVIRDLESTNGTRVNGSVVSEAKIYRGDKLSLGDFDVFLEGDDVPSASGSPLQEETHSEVEEEFEQENSSPAPTPVRSSTVSDEVPQEEPSSGMRIAPRTATKTVKMLPVAQFKKKRSLLKIWVFVIGLCCVLAIVLAVVFFRSMKWAT